MQVPQQIGVVRLVCERRHDESLIYLIIYVIDHMTLAEEGWYSALNSTQQQ